MRDKFKLTEKLVAELPERYKITVDVAMNIWWLNLRPNGGLRLTATGYKTLSEQLNLDFYMYEMQGEHLFQHIMIELDRKLQHPYFILTKKNFPVSLIFFGSQEAMLVNLYGSLQKFLDNYN